ncbi:MAG: T9SS type B sorting domain-containing protein, partial [Bacteroidetes bacterium]|nr:T9SS type B sorting domain-containing protein [Bacteroidota bacterium]
DALGCGSVQVPVFVVDYPRFVTPNGDGYHDTWSVAGLDGLDPSARVYVFDRYGKLLKELAPSGPGWDGTFNGAPVPSDDYWFRIEYDQDGAARQFTGHFTLKR